MLRYGRLAGGLAGLTVWAVSACPALAAPGDLDPSFGNGGKSVVNLGGFEEPRDLLLQPDGKIIVTGSSNALNPSNNDLTAARLLVPQGTLDPSYGGGFGWSRIDMGANELGGSGILQPDGKIIVAGTTDAVGDDYGVGRLLNPQGTFDGSFGAGGFRTGSLGGSDGASAVTLQPDNRIVFAGFKSGPGGQDVLVGRLLNPQATPDGSFGNSQAGFSVIDLGGSADGAGDVAMQPDGKILVAASRVDPGGAASFSGAVLRLAPGGAPDGSFSGDGMVFPFGPSSIARTIVVQPDGKIVVAGNDIDDSFTIARLLPDGTLDESFGGDGRSGVNFGAGQDFAEDVVLQPDGKIIVGGGATTGPSVGGGTTFGIARLQPNGFLDSTFGSDGKALVDFGLPSAIERATGVVLQPDGKVIVAGRAAEEDIGVARLQGDPPGSVKGKCAGKKATIIGTNGKNKLKGTKKKDVISAGKGKDTVKGLKGNDLICGGKAKDKLIGGKGNDTLLGQQGNDTLLGGPDRDKLKGGPGKKDKLKGGPGKDVEKP